MKKSFLSVLLLLVVIASNAQFSSAKLTASGLTCSMCTKAIYNSLEKVPAISKVVPDIKNSAFLITFKDGASIDPDVLAAAVEEAGFSVAKLNLTGNFKNVAVGNNAHVVLEGRTYHILKASSDQLNGEQTLSLVDRKFISAKEFKKWEATNVHPCLVSGKTEACCPEDIAVHNARIYHVIL